MSKLRHEALNYLQILKESINLPLSNPNLILSILFFILFPFNLVTFSLSKLNIKNQEDKIILQAQFITNILQWLNTTLALSLLSKAYIEKPSSILKLLSTLQRQWKRILITAFLTELNAFSCSSLLLLLGYSATLVRFIMVVIGFCVYMFVHLGCQMSIVISSIEESCYGLSAIRRAVEIIRERKVQSFVLMTLIFVFDAIVNAHVPVGIVFQLIWCSVYSVLYLESKKRQETEEDEERWII